MSQHLSGLTGLVPVKDNWLCDYVAHLVVESLLPVCDEVVVIDGGSTDGTRQFFADWAAREPKVRVVDYVIPPLPTYEEYIRDDQNRPKADPLMLLKWIEHGKGQARFDMVLHCDADEPICPKGYEAIRAAVREKRCLWARRLNFWKDAKHLARDGTLVGSHMACLHPTWMEITSDEERPQGEPLPRQFSTYEPTFRRWHVGFLRKDAAFFEKSKRVQVMLLNTHDDRLKRAEREGVVWHTHTDIGELVEYNEGDYPEFLRTWLLERGYEL